MDCEQGTERPVRRNNEMRLAWDFVENTGSSIFLTGKAGTGKTTFLRTLKERSSKRMVVVAPTGVAAINARGMTIHSFFQLPLSPYVPEATFREKFDFSKEKRNIIRTMDLLIIDEISMVRADLLDAVDNVLRRFREPSKPFGGVQLLMIGDLQQLAPVVTDQDIPLLSKYYETPFFFGSKALALLPYVTIELKHVYRQSDEHFLYLLNRVREGIATADDLSELNQRCQPSFRPDPDAGYIRLTTHNIMASQYNESELIRLSTPMHTFNATIEGTFPEYSFPTDLQLRLRVGAQVMFVKNDSSADHLYYNGKIGRVVSIDNGVIVVKCPDDDFNITVEPSEWENVKYALNEKTKEIEADVQGVFRQYPLRLAWAITIHKSQGLTFERAIIDAHQSFASGQVYVALSRCKTLEGMVLSTPIPPSAIINDERVSLYIARQEQESVRSISLLPQLKEHFYIQLLRELFDFSDIRSREMRLLRVLSEHFFQQHQRLITLHRAALQQFDEQVQTVAEKWIAVFSRMNQAQLSASDFQERVVRSAAWFKGLLSQIIGELLDHTIVQTDNKHLARLLDEAVSDLQLSYGMKVDVLKGVESSGFSCSSYLKIKGVAFLQAADNGQPKRKRKREELSADIQHPELYKELLVWRRQKAQELGLEPANVIQQRALINVVNLLPGDLIALKAVSYIGKVTVEKYGSDLVELVTRYAADHQLEVMRGKKVNKRVGSTFETTLQLYQSGKTVEQIAIARELAVSTIRGHLAKYVRKGLLPMTAVMSQKQEDAIRQAIGRVGTAGGLTPILADCTVAVDYDQVRLVVDMSR